MDYALILDFQWVEVFPSLAEAEKAAGVALEIGGFCDAVVQPTDKPVTFQTCEEWFFA